jgi:hypothetical protein
MLQNASVLVFFGGLVLVEYGLTGLSLEFSHWGCENWAGFNLEWSRLVLASVAPKKLVNIKKHVSLL